MFSRRSKVLVSGILSLFLSHVPNVAVAEVQSSSKLISTTEVLNEMSREEALSDIQNMLSREDVQNQMQKAGLDSQEISQRLAALTEQEMRDLHSQMSEARAGGDILITILVVVLIIFLIKRI